MHVVDVVGCDAGIDDQVLLGRNDVQDRVSGADHATDRLKL